MLKFLYPMHVEEVECRICGRTSKLTSKTLGVCVECIRNKPDKSLPFVISAHAESRMRFNLPTKPPKDKDGIKCGLCANDCRIPVGGRGYCGLRENEDGKLIHLAGTPKRAIVECYHDLLPTNCVAEWCCAGGTGSGYPEFSYTKDGPEHGYKNLAVFYGACTFDCLGCQNWHYREHSKNLGPTLSASQLAGFVDEKTSCICYFGGDPTPQMPHALKTSKLALEGAGGRILRICFETNGSMSFAMLKKAAKLSMESGGCIKFDLKAWNENLNLALCGASNEQTLRNFEWLAEYGRQRKEPPFLIASTLLVPGYVDVEEVENISKFIGDLDPNIHYSLLAFHPEFYMEDMPTTSRRHAEECLKTARKYLRNVRIGNVHLLSDGY